MSEIELESTNLKSLSVDELIRGDKGKKYCFIIPSYQRGYRWDSEQVNKLLNDLNEYKTAKTYGDSTVGDFYCLQPIIVKALTEEQVKARMGDAYNCDPNVDYYEIVDGQQRLTTIYILLKYFPTRKPQFFLIEYERDVKSGYSRKDVLEKLGTENLNPSTVDEVYFIEVYDAIGEWFDEKNGGDTDIENEMVTVLKKQTKIIWYELDERVSDCYEVFRNINNGKIPLTDAELVKAMLLNSKLYAPKTSSIADADREIINAIIRRDQERYARLWDGIQHTLCDNQLWSFITGNHDFRTPTRIDFLLQLAVMKSKGFISAEQGKLFAYYEDELSKLDDRTAKREYAESVFESIRKLFRTIQDWYETPIYFNYIGMIMTYTKKAKASEDENRQKRLETLISLMDYYDSNTREDFIKELMNRARNLIGKVTPDFMGYAINSADTPQDISDDNDENDVDDDYSDEDLPDEQTGGDGKTDDDRSAVNYNRNRKDIEKWLMLFNILELNEINEKFDFTIGEGGWSVEHIKAQHSEIAKSEDWKGFLIKEKVRIGEGFDDIKAEIDTVLALQDKFETPLELVMKRIDKEVDGFDEVDEHRLGNLALLSKTDNSAFNNSQFYEKREKMLKMSESNFPYSTRRVFFKVYSEQTYDLDYSKWGKGDFNHYLARQYSVLQRFINQLHKETTNG